MEKRGQVHNRACLLTPEGDSCLPTLPILLFLIFCDNSEPPAVGVMARGLLRRPRHATSHHAVVGHQPPAWTRVRVFRVPCVVSESTCMEAVHHHVTPTAGHPGFGLLGG